VDTEQTRRPTLDTVARAVGVSRATVSNAYNRPNQLSAGLRTRILEVADRLGYLGPDPVARSLATRKSAAVAFMLRSGLSSAFSDPALTIMLDALAATVDGRDHALVLLPGDESGGPRPDSVARAQADVVVAYSLPDTAPALTAVRQRRLPMVVVDQPATGGTARVELDDFGGTQSAGRYLTELGHRDFGVISLTLQPDGRTGPAAPERRTGSPFRVTRERLSGYMDALTSVGIAPEAVPVWEAATSDREHGRTAARWLLQLSPRPTALLCMSDELALGALQGARDAGLSVPQDVSVVGFDDTPPAGVADPPLTTVRQPLVEKGRLAGELALTLLDGGRPSRPVRLDVELVVRASSAAPIR
jgi:DNA-binding LacI/PurR family transcriptional regulator